MTARWALAGALLAAATVAPGAARAATLTISPARAAPGSAVHLEGFGFVGPRAGTLRVGARGSARLRTDPSGRFARTIVLPRRASPGLLRLGVRVSARRLAIDVRVGARPRRLPSTKAVTTSGARLLLSPTVVRAGAALRLSGHVPGRGAALRVEAEGRRAVRTRAGPRGSFSVRVATSPTGAGLHRLRVVSRGTRVVLDYRTLSAPSPPPSPPAGGTVRVAAAGDIACPPGDTPRPAFCQQQATANLVRAIAPSVVLALGDQQYESGTLGEFQGSYEKSWGAFKEITRPVAGNHEYGDSAAAAGYFGYFGARAGPSGQGYYSFEAGAWHVIALNSNCRRVGGCEPGSAQYRWLADDLARTHNHCVLAMWHHALFTSSFYPGEEADFMAPMWQLLDGSGADLVLTGHAHAYERFAPQTASGRLDPDGLRQFVVGSGGEDHRSIFAPMRRPNMEAGTDADFGVLALTLSPTGYSWRFEPVQPSLFVDAGSAACR